MTVHTLGDRILDRGEIQRGVWSLKSTRELQTVEKMMEYRRDMTGNEDRQRGRSKAHVGLLSQDKELVLDSGAHWKPIRGNVNNFFSFHSSSAKRFETFYSEWESQN